MTDQLVSFTVKQATGQDSLVTIHENGTNWQGCQIIKFESDQLLTSNSDRAWEVNQAIKAWARQNGYDLGKADRNVIPGTYNPQAHSDYGEFTVRKAIQEHPAYQEALETAKAEQKELADEYGMLTGKLKNLLLALEKAHQAELTRVRQNLVNVQAHLALEIDIPDYVDGYGEKRLLEPNYPYDKIEVENFNNYGQGYKSLPTSEDLERMLDLI